MSKNYFGEIEEEAIRIYLDQSTTKADKEKIFGTILYPAFQELVTGVLQMPMFSTLIGVTKEELAESCFEKLMLTLPKFDPDRIGKTGELAKAYSFLGTSVKFHAVAVSIKAAKQEKVHSPQIDISNLDQEDYESGERKEDTLKILLENYIIQIELALNNKKNLSKYDKVVGHALIHMLKNWHILDFEDKNQFKRLLSHFSQLSLPIVNRSLKKFSIPLFKKYL